MNRSGLSSVDSNPGMAKTEEQDIQQVLSTRVTYIPLPLESW